MTKILSPSDAKTPYVGEPPIPAVPLDPSTGRPREKRFVTVLRAEKWWIDKSRVDPAFFIEYVTGLAPAKHHRLWMQSIFDFSEQGKKDNKFRLNIIAPRDSAKTTISMYSMAWFIARFPLTSNVIISVSAKQAEARLEMIRGIFRDNTRFHNVFPWIKVDERQRNTIQEFSIYADGLFDPKTMKAKSLSYNAWRSILTRHGSLKDPTLYVSGSGGKGIIGRRISGLMVLDDIIDEAYLKAELQDEVYEYLIRTLIPCVKEEAKVINIGTRWMPEDVPEKLKNNPSWHTIEISALRYAPDGTPMSYWPEYWPVEKLERKRVEMDNDTLFKVMYLNDPTAFVNAKFLPDGLMKPLPETLKPDDLVSIHVGTDFAISIKSDADFTVFAAVGADKDRNLFILDMLRIKTTPEQTVEQMAGFVNNVANKWGKVNQVLIEKVAFQTVMKFTISDKYPHLPINPIPPIGDKGHRTENLARLCNTGRVFFNKDCDAYRFFASEAMNFGVARHDDCLDAVAIVVQHLGASIQGSTVRRIKSPYLL
jgi:predicted phage terminase large subunit-like protein